ncbi:MAG: hypothetical protein LBH92_04525 [Bacteroidales bacterium]|jgi:hypothetical protein|nr:hypothetical protein [Bacteroidales bacterium]
MRYSVILCLLFFASIVVLQAQEQYPNSVEIDSNDRQLHVKLPNPDFLLIPSNPLMPLRNNNTPYLQPNNIPKNWNQFKIISVR